MVIEVKVANPPRTATTSGACDIACGNNNNGMCAWRQVVRTAQQAATNPEAAYLAIVAEQGLEISTLSRDDGTCGPADTDTARRFCKRFVEKQ